MPGYPEPQPTHVRRQSRCAEHIPIVDYPEVYACFTSTLLGAASPDGLCTPSNKWCASPPPCDQADGWTVFTASFLFLLHLPVSNYIALCTLNLGSQLRAVYGPGALGYMFIGYAGALGPVHYCAPALPCTYDRWLRSTVSLPTPTRLRACRSPPMCHPTRFTGHRRMSFAQSSHRGCPYTKHRGSGCAPGPYIHIQL